MNKRALFAFFLCFSVAGLSCVVTAPATPGGDPVGSAVAATQTGQTGGTDTQAPPAPTSETPVLPATPEPACQPVHPGPQVLPLPAGLAAEWNQVTSLKDLQGNVLSARTTADMTFPRSDMVHLAGSLSLGAANLPIVYYTLDSGGYLRSNSAGLASDVAPAADLISLTGAEGQSFLAYVTLDMMNQSTNRMYAGEPADLQGAQPVLTWIPPQNGSFGNALHPLAVHTSGSGNGIWYTYTLHGIGDIHFPPYNGLHYLDLASLQSTEFLDSSNALGGMSPDQTMVAYGAGQGGTPGFIQGGVTLRNLVSCQETYIPFNPASNLGGGWMVFSPDNQFIAWTEAGGPNNMAATFRLRVARTDGTSMVDSPIINMASLFGGEAPDNLRPVGWIADHILVLESYLHVVERYVLAAWAPDPAQPIDPILGANQSFPIADGAFLGFIYP
jgi:hypothetical protein